MPTVTDRKTALFVLVLTPLLAWLAFPPARFSEAVFVLAVPSLWWAGRAPAWRFFSGAMITAWSLVWLVLLAWLYHVTIVGLALIAVFLGTLSSLWFLAARWTLPRVEAAPAMTKVVATLGLGALWVLGEWFRGWLFTGFPWLPLAAAEWQRPVMLALCPLTGAHGVSLLIILCNLGLAAYLARATSARPDRRLGWFTPAFTVAMVAFLAGTFGLAGDLLGQKREPFVRVGIVQPYIPQSLKWDPAEATRTLEVLDRETRKVAALQPDLLLWPEAASPYILKAQPELQPWLEKLATNLGAPLLAGLVVLEHANTPQEIWGNAAVVIDPEHGVQPEFYLKRHLVPFGEYVPLGRLLSWLKKVVPIGDDFQPGHSAAPLTVSTGRRPVAAGVLICYEDVFAEPARTSTAAGAELLVTLTNDAWYGEGAAAYQHAAHSALRAAENRRPLVRCGNGGWSGWFDEFGMQRAVLTNDRGSVYFRGGEVLPLTRDVRWVGRRTLYTERGDWFVGVCAAVVLLSGWVVARRKVVSAEVPPHP